jgi:hypothetical protein
MIAPGKIVVRQMAPTHDDAVISRANAIPLSTLCSPTIPTTMRTGAHRDAQHCASSRCVLMSPRIRSLIRVETRFLGGTACIFARSIFLSSRPSFQNDRGPVLSGSVPHEASGGRPRLSRRERRSSTRAVLNCHARTKWKGPPRRVQREVLLEVATQQHLQGREAVTFYRIDAAVVTLIRTAQPCRPRSPRTTASDGSASASSRERIRNLSKTTRNTRECDTRLRQAASRCRSCPARG